MPKPEGTPDRLERILTKFSVVASGSLLFVSLVLRLREARFNADQQIVDCPTHSVAHKASHLLQVPELVFVH
jgi:hypothetical protein